MLKRLPNARFLGSLALVLFLLAMFGSLSFQECVSSAHISQDQQNSSSLFFSIINIALEWTRLTCVGVFIHDARDEILAAFTVLLAFFTLALWASTDQLANDAKTSADKTIKTMEDTARKELRAYVALEQIAFVGREINLPERMSSLGPKKFIQPTDQLQIRIKNYGKTPSRDTTIWFGHNESGVPGNFGVDGPLTGRQMLHPGMSFNCDVPSPPHTNGKFWVWGHIVYRDIYDRWWRTNFCYAHRGKNEFAPVGKRNNETGHHDTEDTALTVTMEGPTTSNA